MTSFKLTNKTSFAIQDDEMFVRNSNLYAATDAHRIEYRTKAEAIERLEMLDDASFFLVKSVGKGTTKDYTIFNRTWEHSKILLKAPAVV